MRLLDVRAVLDREKNIQQAEPETEVLKDGDDETTSYAILSHRWGAEVNYQEMIKLLKMTERKRDEVRQRDGYQKIIKSCELAMRDGYSWLWVDTCCIDKRNSAELSEAINSMYRWYENSQVCYAYLGDIEEPSLPSQRDNSRFSKSKGWPEWFVRGWTLQELVAPKQLEFFNKNWTYIGNKRRLAPTLEKITRIPSSVLGQGLASKRLSIAQIMSWAADRQTTRVEDRAYSLMGLFGVSMPMLYGEGEKAFQRLQLEIMRVSNDQSIFAWDPYGRMPRYGNVLADDPSYFQDCNDIQIVESDRFIDKLTDYVRSQNYGTESEWHQAAHSQQMSWFVATNAGIQIWLPVIPYRDYPSVFKAILACNDNDGNLISIDLASCGSTYDRSFNATEIRRAYPQVERLYLTYSPDANETPCHLTLDDRGASCYGFTRRSTFPREIAGDTVTLSSRTNDLMVVVYANDETKSRFAIALGFHSGQGWVHVTCNGCLATEEGRWLDFDRKAYDVMWNARAQHALRTMPNEPNNDSCSRCDNFVKHAHIPQSIWAARVVWGRWDAGNLKITVDVEQCPGCCVGPLERTTIFNNRYGLGAPGVIKTVHRSHELKLDSSLVQLDECLGQKIVLGDYGDFSNGNFKRRGNIFEDMPVLGIGPTDTANRATTVSQVSGDEDVLRCMQNRNGLVVTFHEGDHHLALYQPTGLSLANNQQLKLLLKALSERLADKYLVTTVIHCSEFYVVDSQGEPRDTEVSPLKTYGCTTESGSLTPLCAIASPQFWRRESACAPRREQFRSIREHFFDLVNMRQLAGTEVRHRSAQQGGRTADGAITFFADLFGLEVLRKYVGEIAFFKKLSSMTETEPLREPPAGAAKGSNSLARRLVSSLFGWAMKRSPSTLKHRRRTVQDQRPEALLNLLRNKCYYLTTESGAPSHVAVERQNTEHEMKAISQSLSVGLLKCISNTFSNAGSKHIQTAQVGSYIDYDRQANIRSMVQEIAVLQAKLCATKDDDEQRALEEDLTGMVLWLCWCGICQEVEQLLPETVNFICKEGMTDGLKDIGSIIRGIRTYPDDNQAHLQRIMIDAGAGTSKCQLLLDPRARPGQYIGYNEPREAVPCLPPRRPRFIPRPVHRWFNRRWKARS